MSIKKLNRFSHSVIASIALLAAGIVHAADWPNGNLNVIIPSSPGGGFDTYARIISKEIESDIGVKIVPKNVSGGGGMRGAQATYQAKADGQTFGIFNVPGIITPVISGKKVGYDIEKIDWLGAMAFNQYIVVVAKDSPYNSVADLKASGKKISFTGYGSSGVAANKVLCSEIGIECQIISGYPGNNDALLGVVRGDALASVTPITTATSFNIAGDLKGLLLMTTRDVEAFPETQKASDAGYPAVTNLGLIRAFGLPPGVPAQTRIAVQTAFDKALHSDAIKTWSKNTKSPINPMSPSELRKLITEQTALLTKYKDVLTSKK